MRAAFSPDQITVFLPVGGRATRAYEVTGDRIPKHLIELDNGMSVLEVACRQLQRVGFCRFVFCTGHHQEQITNFIRSERWISRPDVSYELSLESTPLGPEGAILNAIHTLGITGQAMFIAGDVMVPWANLMGMNEGHYARDSAAVTAGLTSYVTERTTDVGKFIVDTIDMTLVRLYGRTETVATPATSEVALTSAGLSVVTIEAYIALCERYVAAHPERQGRSFGLRDDVLPWALNVGERGLYGCDLRGEVLDLGTPGNIKYGQKNWSDYVID